MKKRSKASGKTAKPPNRKTLKQSGASHPVLGPQKSTKNKVADVQQLIHERNEALEQQAATSDLLQLISSPISDIAQRHSITLSASNCVEFGISMPSVLAVLRLIAKSNLVGCSTGSSSGLAPLRILSMYVAERRKMTLTSGA